MKEGLLVIRRNPKAIWQSLPTTDRERERILKYRGFFCAQAWPELDAWVSHSNAKLELVDGLAPISKLSLAIRYATSELIEGSFEMLHLARITDNSNPPLITGFRFLGFDVGVIAEWGAPVLFSAVINELRPGGNPVFKDLASRVNENYLFPTVESCEAFLNARRLAFETGRTDFIETAYTPDECEFVAVSAWNPS